MRQKGWDKLLQGGAYIATPIKRRGDLFNLNLARVELEDGNHRLLPKIYLEQSFHDELSVP